MKAVVGGAFVLLVIGMTWAMHGFVTSLLAAVEASR